MYWLWTFAGAVGKCKFQYQCIFYLFSFTFICCCVQNKAKNKTNKKLWHSQTRKLCFLCTYSHTKMFTIAIPRFPFHFDQVWEREKFASDWSKKKTASKQIVKSHLDVLEAYKITGFCFVCLFIILNAIFFPPKWIAPWQ